MKLKMENVKSFKVLCISPKGKKLYLNGELISLKGNIVHYKCIFNGSKLKTAGIWTFQPVVTFKNESKIISEPYRMNPVRRLK